MHRAGLFPDVDRCGMDTRRNQDDRTGFLSRAGIRREETPVSFLAAVLTSGRILSAASPPSPWSRVERGNASAINGNMQRGTGLIQNERYAGRLRPGAKNLQPLDSPLGTRLSAMSWVRPVTDVSGLGHTKAIDDGHRHLITALLAVCERGSGKVQGNLRRQRFVGNE